MIGKIEKDFLHAYKNKDEVRVRVLRLLKTAIKNLQVELQRTPTDDEVLSLIQKQSKQRKDSIAQFITAKREELAAKEEEELGILQEYLPQPITGEELIALTKEKIQTLAITSKKEFGKVMGALTKEFTGRIDGKELQTIVQQLLEELE